MQKSTEQQADDLLSEWHYWSKLYRPKLGYPSVAPYCKQAVSSRQFDDSTTAANHRVHGNLMNAIDFCVGQLPSDLQNMIGIEMMCRANGIKVFRRRKDEVVRYKDALRFIVPIMIKRGVLS